MIIKAYDVCPDAWWRVSRGPSSGGCVRFRLGRRRCVLSFFFFQAEDGIRDRSPAFLLNRSSDLIELNALHTKRQNLFQELDAVIHLLMEAKHWGLRKSRNATSLNSRFKSLDTLKVKIISVTFRRVIRTNHKKASKIWRHENI